MRKELLMKPMHFGIACILATVFIIAKPQARSVQWYQTTESAQWVEKGTPGMEPATGSASVTVDPGTKYQVIDGFGGCFNELGWDAISQLPDTKREEVFRTIFDPVDGCNFNYCRMMIGSSDFSSAKYGDPTSDDPRWFSLAMTPGDTGMEHFSIERDKKAMIPYIKNAMRYNPELKVWGSPWSPPVWLKRGNNPSYAGGYIDATPVKFRALARYFSRYIQTYRAEGINVIGYHPQNEPGAAGQNYPCCGWEPLQIADFIKNYAVPRLALDGIDAEVWYGSVNKSQWDTWGPPVWDDAALRAACDGYGGQWGGRKLFDDMRANYPDVKLMQTETNCCKYQETPWTYTRETWRMMYEDLTNGVSSYMQWNMVLPQADGSSTSGESSWGWKQTAMVMIDTNTLEVTYMPQMHMVRHFKFVQPGAHRIGVSGSNSILAFQNPDGSIVLVTRGGGSPAIQVGDKQIDPGHLDGYNSIYIQYDATANSERAAYSMRAHKSEAVDALYDLRGRRILQTRGRLHTRAKCTGIAIGANARGLRACLRLR
ncbi:MAG: hypothetical protein GF398_01570 [Chitinivibrionales bacterium]|nr:hypothetical protein [Chitinivibrionales bacterium]